MAFASRSPLLGLVFALVVAMPRLALTDPAPVGGSPPALPTAQVPVLVPVHQTLIQEMLRPLAYAVPFGDGCLIEGISLGRHEIELTVRGGGGTRHVLRLAAAADAVGDGPHARSASFIATVAGGALPADPCLGAVWDRLRAADDGTFFTLAHARASTVAATAPQSAPSTDTLKRHHAWQLAYYRFIQVLLLCALLLGLVSVGREVRALHETARWQLALYLAIPVVGVLLRLVWANPSVIHESYCGIERLTCATAPPCRFVTGAHSWTPYAAYNLWFQLVPELTRNAILATVVLGGVAAPWAAHALGRTLFQDARVGLAAAALMAATPFHIRMSASESFYVLAQVLLLAACTALVRFARAGGYGRAVITAVLVALVVQGSRIHNLFAPLALLLYFVARPRGAAWAWGPVVTAAGVFAVTTVVHYADVLQQQMHSAAALHTSFWTMVSYTVTNCAFFQPYYTPLVFGAAGLVGVAVLLWQRRREGLFLAALYFGFAYYVNGGDPDNVWYPTQIRMQFNAFAPLLLIAGVGVVAWLRYRPRGWPVGAVSFGVMLLSSVPFASHYDTVVREQLVPAGEQRLIEAYLPELPPLDIIIVPDFHMGGDLVPIEGDGLATRFPLHDLQVFQGRAITLRTVTQALDDLQRLGRFRTVFYRGTAFHAWLKEEVRAGVSRPEGRPELERFLEHVELEPIMTWSVPNTNTFRVRNHYLRREIPVGFYWVRPKAR